MSNEYIQTEIRHRKIVYYPVSSDDLKSLKEKSISSDVCMIFMSITLSITVTLLLSIYLNQTLNKEKVDLFKVISCISGIATLIFLGLTIRFNYNFKKQLKSFENDPKQLTTGLLIEEDNPKHYIGFNSCVVNINLKQKDEFFKLLSANEKYKLLKTSYHQNTIKTGYFTFKINNGNESLFQDFVLFLQEHNIDYTDYALINKK